MIFVFGSNLDGRHGAGSALYAVRNEGAKLGIGEGLVGNSYALPTVGRNLEKFTYAEVRQAINRFNLFAELAPGLDFKVTRVGCQRAGFTDEQIAPLFNSNNKNCFYDEAWKPWLSHSVKYWGTF